jgi:hypothetical protein
MKEHFQKQLEQNLKVTQEKLDKVEQKSYTSGKEIKIGDIILFALLKESDNIQMVALHEDEIDNYKFEGEYVELLPFISKK